MCICSCVSNEEKQEAAISEYMNKTFEDFPSYECVETIYSDSIQDQPVDYSCLTFGLRTYNAALGTLNPAIEFVESYVDCNKLEEKSFSLNPELLTGIPRQKYFVWMDSVRSFAVLRQELMKKVDNYSPHSYIRVYKKYRICGEGENKFLHARFYFDSNYELVNQLILSEEENTCTYGMISLAMNKDYSILNSLFNKIIEMPNENILNTIAQYPNTPIDELLGMSGNNNVLVTQVNNPSTTDNLSEQSSTYGSYGSESYDESNSYVVIVDKCAGAISEDANNRFAKYSARDNIDEIQRMLVSGELIVLRRGDIVNMLHLGYVTSEVRLQDGRRIFVDTENISKR